MIRKNEDLFDKNVEFGSGLRLLLSALIKASMLNFENQDTNLTHENM